MSLPDLITPCALFTVTIGNVVVGNGGSVVGEIVGSVNTVDAVGDGEPGTVVTVVVGLSELGVAGIDFFVGVVDDGTVVVTVVVGTAVAIVVGVIVGTGGTDFGGDASTCGVVSIT